MSASLTTLDTWWQDSLSALPAQSYQNGQSYFDSEPPFTALIDTASIHPLHQLGLISIEGPDASRFLQGQLTADIEALSIGDSILAAHCDPKGRMHANFYLYCAANNHYLLQLPISVVDTALAALNKYAVFSKATLTDISAQYAAFGLANVNTDTNNTDILASLTINTIGSVQWIKRTAINSFLNSLETEDVQWCGSAAWEYRLISAGISFVQTQTVGEFIPQMFNLDYLGGISFTKGCYTGQEIIARMKYRGKVKRRCYPFITTAANNTLVIGDECLNAEGQLIGTVVSVASDIKNISAQSYGMVAIKVAAAEESSLSIKGETAITITALPYAVDSDDE